MATKIWVNINGDIRENLILDRIRASEALFKAADALRLMAPHGRNYKSNDDFNHDVNIQMDRVKKIVDMIREINLEAEEIQGN